MKLPELNLVISSFTLRANEEMYLPEYKGSMFRGAFGVSFRKVVCVSGMPECTGCPIMGNCIYYNVFETSLPTQIPFFSGVEKIPHPFILNPPLEAQRLYPKGSEIIIEMVVIGEVSKFLPVFVYAFQQMGKTGISYQRSKFDLLKAEVKSADGHASEVYSPERGFKNIEYSCKKFGGDSAPNDNNPLVVNFITPLRMQRGGKMVFCAEDFSLNHFITQLYRRYLTLSHLYCDAPVPITEKLPLNDVKITFSNLFFQDWQRYSNRQKRKMELGGLLGTVTIEGATGQFYELLRAGSFINAGKNSAFGLGRYQLLTSH